MMNRICCALLVGLVSIAVLPRDLIAGEEAPMNVLMIVLDDLNYHGGPLGGHPQSKTPHIDQLAASGVLFANAHANVAVCNPSRASFMTGIAPTSSGCWGFVDWQKNPVLQKQLTLGEYAMKHDYLALQTGKVLHSKKAWMWSELGVVDDYGPYPFDGKALAYHPSTRPEHVAADLGVLDTTYVPLSDVPNVPPSDDAPGYKGWHNSTWKGAGGGFRYVNDEDRDLLTDEKSAQWVENKLKALEADTESKPFFMAMGIIRPHTPLVVPQKYYDMFPLDEVQLVDLQPNDRADTRFPTKFGTTRGNKAYEALKASYEGDEGLRRFTQAYLASVAFADEMVGRALDALENSRFADNTVVILFGDHGWALGEKDELWKYTLWKESTQVPFIIRHPDYPQSAGAKVAHPVSLLDVFPSVKDFCGWEGSNARSEGALPLAGASLRPYLANPHKAAPEVSDVAVSIVASWRSQRPQEQHYSAVSKDFRYIKYFPEGEELYDLNNDPKEWTNLADNPEYASTKKDMHERLFAWVEEMAALKPAE